MAVATDLPFAESNPNQRNPGQEHTAGRERSRRNRATRDDIQAAKLDTLANRRIDAKSSHLYVHPPVKGDDAVNYIPFGF